MEASLFFNHHFMNNLITTEKNLTTSIPLIDVVEDFVLTKNSKHTQRAYRSDLV
jgi:hypothetical protein